MDKYETDCGYTHFFHNGGMASNKFVWCPYCGGELLEIFTEDRECDNNKL